MTRKKKKRKKKVNGTSITETIRANATKAFGDKAVPSMEEFNKSIYGIPIVNNLPLQYLLGIDVWPLSRFATVVGKESTTKSGFTYYLGKMFAQQGYTWIEVHTEGKPNPDQVHGTFQDEELVNNHFIPITADSMDELIDELNGVARFWKQSDPDDNFALLLTLDSLACVTSQKFIKDSQEEGADHTPGYNPAKVAHAWQEHLKVFGPTFISKKPVSFVMINHQKPKMDGANPNVKTEPGGTHKEFNFVTKLSFRRPSRRTNTSSHINCLQIKNEKSGVGVTGRMIKVDYVIDLKDQKYNKFDYQWDKALVTLLRGGDISKTDLHKVLHIEKSGTKYTCKEAGVTKGTKEEVGKAIHADEELTKALQEKVLYIKRKTKLVNGEKVDPVITERDDDE